VVEPLKNIIDILSARSSSEALAYVFLTDGTSDSELRWTFADTARKSVAFAGHLRDRNISAGERVVLALNPSLEYVAALYGIMQIGAIPVPCFPPLRPKELERFHAITLDCSPQAIVIDAMYGEQIEKLRGRVKSVGLEPVVVYPEHVAASAAEVNPVQSAPSDVALIQYTSGSTGSPKGVCLTHDNLVSNCQSLDRSMGHDPRRVGLSWLPPYHDMGLMGTIILSMYHGWPLVLMSPMHFIQQPRRWLEAINDYGVTITVGPNFSLDLCAQALKDDETNDLDLSTVRELYCGAEPISADTFTGFERTLAPLGFDGTALIPCYGMAEATLFVAGKRAGSRYRTDRAPEANGSGRVVVSCGEVDSQHEVRIVDPATLRRVDDGVVGEIWVSGRSVAAGYYNRPELTSATFQAKLRDEAGEYLRTGDLGFIRSGELFVTGRIKDLIIVSGRNIYPQDVEAAVVRADPAVRIAAAFSINGEAGEQLCVVAETGHEEASPTWYPAMVEAIRSCVTAEFGVGPDIHICRKRTIPTTTSGKVCRQETRRLLLANTLHSFQMDSLEVQGCTA
jgi:acyl-CoA synthetase (AMP-forming)/AMP-acid ligase II